MRRLIALVGLAVLIMGGYYVVQRYSKEIPQILQERALAALDNINAMGVTVELDGRNAYLSGAVPTANLKETARSRVAAIPGIRDVDVDSLKVQTPDRGPVDAGPVAASERVALTAAWAQGRLELSGHVTGEALRVRIAQKVAKAFEGVSVDQRGLEVRAGDAPEELVKLVAAGLQALSRASEGKLQVDDRSLKLEGVAPHARARQAITDYLKGQVTSPVKLGLALSVTPPVIKPVAVDAAAPSTADAGPTDEEAAARQDAAAAVDTAVELDTTVQVDAAAELDTTVQVDAAAELDTTVQVDAAAELDTTVQVDAAVELDTTVQVDTAVAAEADTPTATAARVTGLPPELAAVVQGDVPHGIDFSATSRVPMEQCQDILRWLVEGEKRITFDKRNRPTAASDAKLQVVAKLLARCEYDQVMVEAFMDTYGEPDALRRKTRRRAFNVRRRLIALGVDAKQVTFAGLGYHRPRYPNTKKKRHLNRRVEFRLIGGK